MEVLVFVLFAMSLAMAPPMAIGIPNPVQTGADASRTLSFRTPAPPVEPRQSWGQTSNEKGVQDDDVRLKAHGGDVPDNITEITDKYLFRLSIDEFEAQRGLRQPPALDWSSDECTKSPNRPLGYNFVPSCHRHDFGLRNYRKQGRLTKTTKRPIDDQFYKELVATKSNIHRQVILS
ncbi:hypothetical protein KVR01_007771 [Diaporthe batatas]|uniref:uncharacterized protein n=1 Tax=Diaporthe batatas TaxID=748121 RepID=UPI001D03F400|nr:uncharacterized protein KVR01_007771 [Diaporthe batatas]KAG8162006.1 hypothetical protein KVR01_007771 [Diaporthe batatas]